MGVGGWVVVRVAKTWGAGRRRGEEGNLPPDQAVHLDLLGLPDAVASRDALQVVLRVPAANGRCWPVLWGAGLRLVVLGGV